MTAVYTNAKYLAATDSLGWVNPGNVFRALLVGAGYTYSAAHIYVSHVASEVVHASYSRQNITNRSVVLDLGADRARLLCDNVIFGAVLGFTAHGAVVYRQVGGSDGTPADDPLLCHLSFAAPLSPTGQTIQIEWDPVGILAFVAG